MRGPPLLKFDASARLGPMDTEVLPLVTRVGLPSLVARRYYDEGHTEHLRLALILLEGATEALLRRVTQDSEVWFRIGELTQRTNEEAAAEGLDPLPIHRMQFPSTATYRAAAATAVYLSNRQRKKLNYEFAPNVDVAFFFERLDLEQASALKALHEYRNAAYHRNVHNTRTAKVLVAIHLRLAAELMRSIRPVITRVWPPEDSEPVRRALGLEERYAVSLSGVADAISEGIEVNLVETARAFAEDLNLRLGQTDRRLSAIRSDLGVTFLSNDDMARLIQTEQPWPTDIEIVRATQTEVTGALLADWKRRAAILHEEPTALAVFSRFVEIDEPLTEFERQISLIEIQVDREVQSQIDELRGR